MHTYTHTVKAHFLSAIDRQMSHLSSQLCMI